MKRGIQTDCLVGKGKEKYGQVRNSLERRERLGIYGKVREVLPHAYEMPGPGDLFS